MKTSFSSLSPESMPRFSALLTFIMLISLLVTSAIAFREFLTFKSFMECTSLSTELNRNGFNLFCEDLLKTDSESGLMTVFVPEAIFAK